MAFSDFHFGAAGGADNIRQFFEGRFFESRYILLLRNPIATILSMARLSKITDNTGIEKQIIGWLTYVQFWADCLRVFPNVLPLNSDRIDANIVDKISEFTNLDLGEACKLLDDNEKYTHNLPEHFTSLIAYSEPLKHIFRLADEAMLQNRIFWQADQKRDAQSNDTRNNPSATISIVPHLLGQVWAEAGKIKKELCGATS